MLARRTRTQAGLLLAPLLLVAPALPIQAAFPSAIQTVCDLDTPGCVGGVQGLAGVRGVAVAPGDEHLYAVSSQDGALILFGLDAADGRLVHVQTVFDTDAGVDGLDGASGVAVSPDGKHVYTAAAADAAVAAWSRDPTTGAVGFIEAESDGVGGVAGLDGARSVAVSPDGKHVYVAGSLDDAVAVFSRNAVDGTLDFLEAEVDGAGSNDGLDGAEAVVVSPDGKHVYVASKVDGAVAVFERQTNSGAPDFGELTFVEAEFDGVGPNDGLAGASALALDSSGDNVYVASERGELGGIAGDDWAAVFLRDSATGALTFLQGLDEGDFNVFKGCTGVGNESSGVAVAPGDAMVLLTNPFRGAVASFDRDPLDGSLTYSDRVCTKHPGAKALAGVIGIAVNGAGVRAYAAASASAAVTALCSGGTDLDLTDTGVVSGEVVEIGCQSIRAGGASGGYRVVEPGNVLFRAPRVALDNGFEVGANASFAVVDTLGPPQAALAPQATLLYPIEGAGVLPQLPVNIGFRVEDDLLVDTFTLTAGADTVASATAVAAKSFEGQSAWLPPAGAGVGDTFVIRLEVTDYGGRTASDEVTVEVPAGTVLTGDQTLDSGYDGQSLILADGTFTVLEALDLLSLELLDGAVVVAQSGLPLDLQVSGRLRIAAGARIDVSGLGFPGGSGPTSGEGGAPAGLDGSFPDAGGSHGGVGARGGGSGLAGEVYDSVYVPSLAGGGGAQDDGTTLTGRPGGGVATLTADELVLEGEILARGSDALSNRPSGAGGSVTVTAASLEGPGLIDASGGDNPTGCSTDVGTGGGGRVAVHAEALLGGFDPAIQVRARGGANTCVPATASSRIGAAGTVYVADLGSTYGRLIVDQGETAGGLDRQGLTTELPALGTGAVAATEVSGPDLWLTGGAPFRARWLGVWVALVGAAGEELGAFEVIELDPAGRTLLAGAGAVAGAASYAGEYRFDRIDQLNSAGLNATDPLLGEEVVIADGDSVMPRHLAAGDLTIVSGAVARAGAEGILEATVAQTFHIEAGGLMDLSGQGFPGGSGSTSGEGGAPLGLAGSFPDAGGSHGGSGAQGGIAGMAGEVFGSVYLPSLAGGGGAQDNGSSSTGLSGGGVATLAAGDLVLDGEIRARGSDAQSNRPSGAGGSVTVTAGSLAGPGLIDVSGGDNPIGCSTDVGTGGGGRVALHAEALVGGFDPVTQVRAWGGANGCVPGTGSSRIGAAGTVYVADLSSTYGRLIVNQGETAGGLDRKGLTTELPLLGSGAVAAVEGAGGDLWVTGGAPFRSRWLGSWMALLSAAGEALGTFEVTQIDLAGRAFLAGAGAVAGAASYAGEYRFDRIDQLNGGGLNAADPLFGGDLSIADGDSVLPRRITADNLSILAGAVARAGIEGIFEASVSGTVRVEAGALLDLSGQGFPGGTGSTSGQGGAPPGLAGSFPDAGGSHGGVGAQGGASGLAGEVYDSVYVPSLLGGGGAQDNGTVLTGLPGGGVVTLTAGGLVLDGEIRARGGDAEPNRPPGAGGSVMVRVASVEGPGLIDASGGDNPTGCSTDVGAGGGGRVALHADALLGGFDPTTQLRAWGGANGCVPGTSSSRIGAAGTVYVADLSSTYGRLIVNAGVTAGGADRQGPVTELSELGIGAVVATEVSGPDLWVTGGAPFRPRWRGAWMMLLGAASEDLGAFEVLELDLAGRALLAGAGAVAGVASYAGEYRFDRIDQLNGGGLNAVDPLLGGDLSIADGDSMLPRRIEASSLTIASGAVARAGAEGTFEAAVAGTVHIEAGASLDLSGQGFAGGTGSTSGEGGAPSGIAGSFPDAGGSHGGIGAQGAIAGLAGEIYDSVYVPSLAGGGGAQDDGTVLVGLPGGGVVNLTAGDLVLDGEIRARGGDAQANRPPGAGGSVMVSASSIQGPGLIDASGGDNPTGCSTDVGAGGGGRVALRVNALGGFDPLAQVKAWGGVNGCVIGSSSSRVGAAGTLYISESGSTYGRLVVNAGETAGGVDREGPATELPLLGGGAVAATEVAGSDLWVTGGAPFRTRWLGSWMALLGAAGEALGTFEVSEIDPTGRALLAGAGAVAGAASYAGEYRFDRIDQLHGGNLEAADPLTSTDVVIADGDSTLPRRLEASNLTIVTGAVARAGAQGIFDAVVSQTMHVESGAVLDLSGQGFAGGSGPTSGEGGAPSGIAGSFPDAGGSHGGVGARGATTGLAGEVYDSVYLPSLPGGGGAQDDGTTEPGLAGGGAATLTVGVLILDGEIRARGGDAQANRPPGAGGSVTVNAASIQGPGLIDASGGDNPTGCSTDVGAGGGGRVALWVDALGGFDPLAQVKVWGGINGCVIGTGSSRVGAAGTVYLSESGSTYGRLVVNAGETASGVDREGPATELPPLGAGVVAAAEVSGPDLWVTGGASFRPRWRGAWMTLLDAVGMDLGAFRVAEIDPSGRALLAAAGAFAGAASYAGEYRFDRVDQLSGGDLESSDPLTATELVVMDGDSRLPRRVSAELVTVVTGAVARAGATGIFEATVAQAVHIESGAALDVTGQGYAGGAGAAGGAPPTVTGSLPDAGGSHGGLGAPGGDPGPGGDAFDSVYFPSLPGGGGSQDSGTPLTGRPGGGAVILTVDNLVLDGDILARGGEAQANRPPGAGGAVLLTATAVQGSGLIDASGGAGAATCSFDVGAGGGGRVALYLDSLAGFDPATRVKVVGGVNGCVPGTSGARVGAPGTLYLFTTGDTFGDLVVQHIDPSFTGVPRSVATFAGAGTIGVVDPDAGDPTAVWVEAQEVVPGEPVLFGIGAVGMWLRVAGTDYRILDQSADGVRVLLAGAAGAVAVGDPYQGLYKFDRLTVGGGATLEFGDLVEVPTVQIDEGSFLVSPFSDIQPPRLKILLPSVQTTRSRVLVSYEDPDNGSGMEGADAATLVLEIDGESILPHCLAGTLYASCDVPGLALGPHTIHAEIHDLVGNLATATTDFERLAPAPGAPPVFEAVADCAPESGPRPLSVLFRTRGEAGGGAIERYRWDFEGDGVFDTEDEVPVDYQRLFDTVGLHIAILEVTNNLDEISIDLCAVAVVGNAPTAQASVTPSNGPAPLAVTLTCVGSDAEGPISLYEWDFEGDGSFDFSSETSGSTGFTYTAEGEYTAVCRVTDGDGEIGLASTADTVVRVTPAGSPTVEATADPTSGVAPLLVSFSGTADDDGSIVLWEWDFEGNGSYDFFSAVGPDTSHTYPAGGIFPAALRVTDDQGLSAVDNIGIFVEADASLTIPDDTFEPTLGETVAIDTTLSGDAAVRVLIKDGDGVVRRLLADEFRLAGAYSDIWDGTNDLGQPLPHGPYFAVLEYVVGSETRFVDHTNQATTSYAPPRAGLPPSFSPFENDLLEIDFTIPPADGASEVIAFVGLFFSGERFATLLNRVPLGVGNHRIVWDGIDVAGNLAQPPPGESLLVGMLGYPLPPNAIMLQSAPVLSSVTVEPNLFDPATPDFISPVSPLAQITYTLDRLADVELTVTNLQTGAVIRQVVDPLVAAGNDLTIAWDGRATDGRFADSGGYRLTLRAIDSAGSASLARFALMRVGY